MCLAVPMKIMEIKANQALVELGGLRKKINLGLLEKISVGDYVVVHAGFAIQKLDEKEARKTLSALRQMSEAL
ncbi:MAG: HypC/HybG/HupF family hydrogenase formation chaperone [Candidatus Omnitrophica bacterium]|nr:HypC/HybG/HupF family hydrogenase formation chaperone [Candidatus Omnitrophota bacterium]